LAALLSLLNYFFRIARWSVYLKRFGFRFPAAFTGLSYVAGFAFTLSPGKVGEMVRARYYKEAGVPLGVTTAAFFVERMMDMLAMASMALVGFAVSSGYSLVLWICFGGILALLAILGATPWERSQLWLMRHQHLPAALRNTVAGVLRILISARSLLCPRLLAFGFFLGLFAWGAEGLGLMVLGSLVPSVPIDWATASGIYAVAVLIGALSFLPGGLGTTEVVMATLLVTHGYAMPQAILLTMVCRILTLWLAVILGWSAVLVLRHYPEQESIKS
jgi:glycosyltransferase 2 family protein